jgi:Fic family protein
VAVGNTTKMAAFFAWLPIETLVHENQEAYYHALQMANNDGESTVFVEFMLQMIRDALKELAESQNEQQKKSNVGIHVSVNVGKNVGTNEQKVLLLLQQDGRLTIKVLAETLTITPRQVERIIAKLKKQGLLIRHGASKGGYWQVNLPDK